MRLEQRARTRRLTAGGVVTAVVAAALAVGCGRPTPNAGDVTASWALEPPAPASHASTRARLTLRTTSGAPVRGAVLRIEGHMAHPGMAPVVSDAVERAGGVYEAQLSFTMAGGWTLVADGTLPDGRRLTRSLTISDVR